MTIVVERETEVNSLTSITADVVKSEDFVIGDDAEEQGKCRAILAALSSEEIGAMPDKNMPLRHLRAEDGEVDKAISKLKSTLKWRKEFGVSEILAGSDEMMKIFSVENATGKIYARGYDADGRAILYLKPGLENTKDEKNQMRHLVYNLERAIASSLRKSGGKVEKLNILIDFEGFSLWNAPPLSSTKETLNILQNHYPERMYRAYLCNPPGYFSVFWAMAKPFIDPVTKEKIVFCKGASGMQKVKEAFPNLEKLEFCAGGKADRVFDSKEYLSTDFSSTFDE
mmetsp:Transcript_14626/g.22594  ORF Transcript_14626/g.22594 Transcript_14626/m.22594 type:complete len:284 (-) Transcript_14626:148-999(-)